MNERNAISFKEEFTMYDVIIIGAGPAGISAGIYAVSRGMKTAIIEKKRSGWTDWKGFDCNTLYSSCRE